jgi:mannosyl-oligosaccharide alpha-1,2-mannosidase
MPEISHFVACQSKESCTWDTETWKAAVLKAASTETNTNVDDIITHKKLAPGFTDIGDRRYILRPEAIESVFIYYRLTGDDDFRDAAWDMFSAVQNVTVTEYANAAISDITATASDGYPPKDDRMESFWLAETLKYFYLIFSEPDLISLDDYVLNTEAHPFRRPG